MNRKDSFGGQKKQSKAKGLKRSIEAEKREDCGVWETTDRKYEKKMSTTMSNTADSSLMRFESLLLDYV